MGEPLSLDMQAAKRAVREREAAGVERLCTECGEWLAVGEFTGRWHVCKDCRSERVWLQRHGFDPDSMSAAELVRYRILRGGRG